MIYIYSKEDCPNCKAAADLCESKGLEYTVFKLGVDYSREDLMALVPGARSVPQIFEHEEYIGDFTKFKQNFVDNA